jgi:hypothetical protein
MSLHQQVLADAPATSRSDVFRLKAQFSEQRAQEATDPWSKRDWEELGTEWHMMANLAAAANPEISQTEASQRTTIPEKVLVRRRIQILDNEQRAKQIQSAIDNDEAWVKSFARRLSIIIHRIGRKRLS